MMPLWLSYRCLCWPACTAVGGGGEWEEEQGLDRASSSLMRNGSKSLVLEFVAFCQFFSPFRSTVRKKILFQIWCMPSNLELKDARFWGEQLVLCSVEVLTFFMDIKGLFSPIKNIVTQLSLLCTRLVWLGDQSLIQPRMWERMIYLFALFSLSFSFDLSPAYCLLPLLMKWWSRALSVFQNASNWKSYAQGRSRLTGIRASCVLQAWRNKPKTAPLSSFFILVLFLR